MRTDLTYWLKYVGLVAALALIGDYLHRRYVA